MKKCSLCLIIKEDREFYRRGIGLRSECKECHKKDNKIQYIRNSAWYKDRNNSKLRMINSRKRSLLNSMGGSCIRCGYSSCLSAIEFHHTNPEDKNISISGFAFIYKYEQAMEESKKTVPLCCRCHRELHAGLWNIEEIKTCTYGPPCGIIAKDSESLL